MAGKKPGPAKGSGGAPRKKVTKPRPGDGYVRVTVGPKGAGKTVYKHRAALGLLKKVGKGSKKVVDHKDKNPKNNSKKNLRQLGRGKNANR
jgi:hypothetical protein